MNKKYKTGQILKLIKDRQTLEHRSDPFWVISKRISPNVFELTPDRQEFFKFTISYMDSCFIDPDDEDEDYEDDVSY